MISTVPHPVWNLLTVNVSSGLQMANSGRWVGLLNPRFKPPSSFVMTQDKLVSLPEADRVRMLPWGRAFAGTSSFKKNFQGSISALSAPSAMHLAESITLPPPTARMNSTCSLLHSSIPSFAKDKTGFGCAPPKRIYSIPCSLKDCSTSPSRPLFLTLPPP